MGSNEFARQDTAAADGDDGGCSVAFVASLVLVGRRLVWFLPAAPPPVAAARVTPALPL
jgi:hypothetical protein